MKKLGFGCMRLPVIKNGEKEEFDKSQIIKMVDTFLEKGFIYFDTAYMYHNHKSERVVKEVLVERYPRDKFILATKLPTMFLKKKEDMERIFNEQLEKTGAGFFDYYLLHCLNTELYERAENLDAFGFISKKRKEGKVKKIGFSFHDNARLLDKILTNHPEIEFVQLQINYLDWESESVQSRKCYEVALKHNKEIIVMEPVKGGTLANVPTKAEKLLRLQDNRASIASWAIRFAASLENVIMVLSGMSNLEQLSDNVGYMENFIPLNSEENKLCLKVADIINSTISIPCTACKYCVEGCPINIAIPELFNLYNSALTNKEVSFDKVKAEYNSLIKKSGNPNACIKCKQCESHCPQHIEIVENIKKVSEYFED